MLQHENRICEITHTGIFVPDPQNPRQLVYCAFLDKRKRSSGAFEDVYKSTFKGVRVHIPIIPNNEILRRYNMK